MDITINTDKHTPEELSILVDMLREIGEYSLANDIEEEILNERAEQSKEQT